uniref:Uncharacterized protein n=1 Tax=Setaria italica TaxID=4555 RepID=K4AN01_SETIT
MCRLRAIVVPSRQIHGAPAACSGRAPIAPLDLGSHVSLPLDARA